MVSVWRCVVRLTALAFLLHQGEATMKHIMRTFPLPTVLQVQLIPVWTQRVMFTPLPMNSNANESSSDNMI